MYQLFKCLKTNEDAVIKDKKDKKSIFAGTINHLPFVEHNVELSQASSTMKGYMNVNIWYLHW